MNSNSATIEHPASGTDLSVVPGSDTMRLIAMTVLAVFIAMLVPGAEAQAPVVADAHVTAGSATNSGGANRLTLAVASGKTAASDVYIRVDLSRLPAGATADSVSKATIKLYTTQVTSAGAFDVYRVVGAWSELAITDANRPPLGPVEIVGVSVNVKDQYLLLDVTSLVRAWLTPIGQGGAENNGMALRPSPGSSIAITLDSKESSGTSHDAEIQIDYTDETVIQPLRTQIEQEVLDRQNADVSALAQAGAYTNQVAAIEAAERTLEDQVLQTAIASEATRAQAAESVLVAGLSAEAGARQATDNTKANLAGGNSFTGDQTIADNLAVLKSISVTGDYADGRSNISTSLTTEAAGSGRYAAIAVGQAPATGIYGYFTVGGSNSGSQYWYHQDAVTLAATANSKLYINAGAQDASSIVVDTNGNVGVRNDTPSQPLDVAGNIHSSGNVSAVSFSGDGSGLTDITAASATNAQHANTADVAGSANFATTSSSAIDASALGGTAAANYARVDVGNSFSGTQSVSGDLHLSGSASAISFSAENNQDLIAGFFKNDANVGSNDALFAVHTGFGPAVHGRNTQYGGRAGFFEATARNNPNEWNNSSTTGLETASNGGGPALLARSTGGGPAALFTGGNVGIGTSSPAQALDVAGNIAVNGSPVIDASGNWVGNSTGLTGPAGPQGEIGPQGPQGPMGVDGLTGAQGPSGASPFALNGNDAVYTQGNVGVGTATPGQNIPTLVPGETLIHVKDPAGRSTRVVIEGDYAYTDWISPSAPPDQRWLIFYNHAGTAAFVSDADDASHPIANNILTMKLATGNVGVGTGDAQHKLDVAGNINSSGNVNAASFTGDGSGLTNLPPGNLSNLNASNLTSGTVPPGVMSGTYDVSISGNAATATTAASATSAGMAGSFSGALGGDVIGGQATTMVAALRGVPLAPTAPNDGQVLQFNETVNQWQPTAVSNGGSSAQLEAFETKSTTSTAYVDMPGMSIDFTSSGRPLFISATFQSTFGGNGWFGLVIDGPLGVAGGPLVPSETPTIFQRLVTSLSPGPHVVKLQFRSLDGGTPIGVEQANLVLMETGGAISSQGPIGFPSNITATAGPNSVSLSWNAVSGAGSYLIKKRGTGFIGPVGTTTSVAYSDGGMASGLQVCYVVASVNASGKGPDSPEVCATTQ